MDNQVEKTSFVDKIKSTYTSMSKKTKLIILAAIALVVVIIVCSAIASAVAGASSGEEDPLFSEGLLCVQQGKKWGYLGTNGKMKISAKFDEAYAFAENGLARVRDDDEWGYIGKNGKFKIEPQFDAAKGFAENGLAAVRDGDEWGYINKKGKFVIKAKFDEAETFNEYGLAVVCVDGEYGVINKKGDYVVKTKYTYVGDFAENGLAVVAEINKDGETLYGYINKKGDEVIKPEYADARMFDENGYATVCDDGEWGVIDKKGEIVVDKDEWLVKGVGEEPLAPYADGAAALLVMSGEEAQAKGIAPLAEVKGFVVVGADPAAPQDTGAMAVQKLLKNKGLALSDLAVLEIIENSAEDELHVVETLGEGPAVNPMGGALAFGKNDGAEGIFITTHLLSINLLRRFFGGSLWNILL